MAAAGWGSQQPRTNRSLSFGRGELKVETMADDEGEVGNVFDALDAADEEVPQEEGEAKKVQVDTSKISNASGHRESKVYRVPVTLYKDETTGEQFFYLQKGTFPNRSITGLNIVYTQEEKDQVREQVLSDKTCPQVMLRNVKVECSLSGATKDDDPNEYLNDESFRLSGSKIGAIRMRMYAKQKIEAQKQLEDPNCQKVVLRLDIECRLAGRDPQQ